MSTTSPGTRLRPPRAFVVRDPPSDEIGARVDWSRWYLTDEEDMGRSGEQTEIIDVLDSQLVELAAERGWTRVYVGKDQFFAWVESEPLVRVSPDVYILDDPPARPFPKMWTTWQREHKPPRVAVEIVSSDWKKDYEDNPPKYAQLGTSELIIFDPDAATGSTRAPERVPLQLYRRDADGAFVRLQGGHDAAYLCELDVWLHVRTQDAVAWLELTYDPAGHDPVPTAEQALQLEQQARKREEEARRDAEAKLAAALAEIEKLRSGA